MNEALTRQVLAELAKPRWQGKFGPSSWDLRALLQQQGTTVSAPELLALLTTLRARGWLRYQAPPGSAAPSTVGNIRITDEGRAQLAAASGPTGTD